MRIRIMRNADGTSSYFVMSGKHQQGVVRVLTNVPREQRHEKVLQAIEEVNAIVRPGPRPSLLD